MSEGVSPSSGAPKRNPEQRQSGGDRRVWMTAAWWRDRWRAFKRRVKKFAIGLFRFALGAALAGLLWVSLTIPSLSDRLAISAKLVGADISSLAESTPPWLAYMILLVLASVFLSRPIASLLVWTVNRVSAGWCAKAASWHNDRNEKARSAFGYNSSEHLDWPDIVSFLMSEKYNSIVSRLHRLEIVSSVRLRDQQSVTEVNRHVGAVLNVLYLVLGALKRSGATYSKEHATKSVNDDLPPLRQRIKRLEWLQAKLQIARVLRYAALILSAAGAWVYLSAGTLSPICRALGLTIDPASPGGASGCLFDSHGIWIGLNQHPAFEAWAFQSIGAMVAAVTLVISVALISYWVVLMIWNGVIAGGSQSLLRVATLLTWLFLVSVGIFYIQATAKFSVNEMLNLDSISMIQLGHVGETIQLIARPGSDLSELLGDLGGKEKIVFLIRVAVAGLAGVVVFNLVRLVALMFEFSPQRRQGAAMALPPDLIMIAGGFCVFIVVTLMLYMAGLEYLRLESYASGASGASEVPSAQIVGAAAEDFIPYSVFLAIVGAVMAVATRDLLENYFSGLAFRVDSPFEQGDRVSINNGEIAEVQRVGVRTIQLFGIRSNSILNYTHKELSSAVIQNFTLPTFEFRREVSIDAPFHSGDAMGGPDLLTRLEGLLLFAGNATTGVKRSDAGPLRHLVQSGEFMVFINNNSKDSGIDLSKFGEEFKKLRGADFKRTSKKLKLGRIEYGRKDANHRYITADLDMLRSRALDALDPSRVGIEDGAYSEFSACWLSLWFLDRERGGEVFERLHVGRVLRTLRKVCTTISRRPPEDPPDKREDEQTKAALALMDADGKPNRDPAYNRASRVHPSDDAMSIERAIRAMVMLLLVEQIEFEAVLEQALGVERQPHGPDWETRVAEFDHRMFVDPLLATATLSATDYNKLSEISLHISQLYAQIAIEMWRLREIDSRQISSALKREIDSACTELLTPPRVSSQRMLAENATPFWRARLHLTVETAEQSEEILQNVNRVISRFWQTAALP